MAQWKSAQLKIEGYIYSTAGSNSTQKNQPVDTDTC